MRKGTQARIDPATLKKLGEFLAARLGWSFSKCREKDLLKGITHAATELGFSDVGTFIEHLTTTSWTHDDIQTLAAFLTVGETYFFRHMEHFEVLRDVVLPKLVRERWFSGRTLRFWSAGCCTGEEPYTLASFVHECIPNVQNWNISILGTDINTRFLRKARDAEYTEWSLRSTPDRLRRRYFDERRKGRYALVPKIRRMVRFGYLNLADSTYPSASSHTQNIDVILLRNVLIYFTEEQAVRVIERMRRALAPDGVLIVTATEAAMVPQGWFHRDMATSTTLFFNRPQSEKPSPARRRTPNAMPLPIVHQRKPRPVAARPVCAAGPLPQASRPPQPEEPSPRASLRQAVDAYKQGRYEEAVGHLQEVLGSRIHGRVRRHGMKLIVKALSNLSRWQEARCWCLKAIEAERLSVDLYYLLATVHLEEGASDEAERALRSALYLDDGFVPAHFMLGVIQRQRGAASEARSHLGRALRILKTLPTDLVVTGTEGITVSQFSGMIERLAS